MKSPGRWPIAAFLLALLAAGAGADQTISVLDLDHSGISDREMVILVDYLTNELVSLGGYQVVDRSRREQILTEIEFSASDCTDESCQIQVGRLLSATRIVAGSVGLFGGQYVLNLKLLDVERGTVVRTVSRKYKALDPILDDARSIVSALVVPGGASRGNVTQGNRRGLAIEVSAGAGYAGGRTQNWYRSPSGSYTHIGSGGTVPAGGALQDIGLDLVGPSASVGLVYQFSSLFSAGVTGGAYATFVKYTPAEPSGDFSNHWVWSPVIAAKIVFGDKVGGFAVGIQAGYDNGPYGGLGVYYRGLFALVRSYGVVVDASREYVSGGAALEMGYSIFLGR